MDFIGYYPLSSIITFKVEFSSVSVWSSIHKGGVVGRTAAGLNTTIWLFYSNVGVAQAHELGQLQAAHPHRRMAVRPLCLPPPHIRRWTTFPRFYEVVASVTRCVLPCKNRKIVAMLLKLKSNLKQWVSQAQQGGDDEGKTG